MKFSDTTWLWRINLCALSLGLLLFIIGFASNHLLSSKWQHVGLWEFCYTKPDRCDSVLCVSDDFNDKYHWKAAMLASRYLLVIDLISILLVITLNGLLLLLPRVILVSILAGGLAIVSVVTGIIGASTFVLRVKAIQEDKFPDNAVLAADWSFTLIMLSAVISLLSGIYQLWAAKRQRFFVFNLINTTETERQTEEGIHREPTF